MNGQKEQKFVFLDLDGTIYNKSGKIPDSVRIAIAGAKADGHKIFLDTGRSIAQIPGDILELKFDGIITSGGACIVAEGRQILNKFIDTQLLEELYEYLFANQINFVVETNDLTYGTKEHIEMQRKRYLNNRNRNEWKLLMEQNRRQIFDVDETPKEGIQNFIKLLTIVEDMNSVKNVNKIVFYNSLLPIEKIKNSFHQKFNIYLGKTDESNRTSGEIYNFNYNKSTGIEKILKYYAADKKNTVAFGDGANDLEMIGFAGMGIAMGNAIKELKEAADFITRENDDDGLYYGFMEAGLI